MKRILIIEDDEDDRAIMSEALEGLNIPVAHSFAVNGEDGMRKLLASETLPDIIFLDLNMPVMNGKQFLDRVKAHQTLNRIPIVIFSTSSDSVTIQETKQLGAQDFITKPDNFELFKKTIRSMLINL